MRKHMYILALAGGIGLGTGAGHAGQYEDLVKFVTKTATVKTKMEGTSTVWRVSEKSKCVLKVQSSFYNAQNVFVTDHHQMVDMAMIDPDNITYLSGDPAVWAHTKGLQPVIKGVQAVSSEKSGFEYYKTRPGAKCNATQCNLPTQIELITFQMPNPAKDAQKLRNALITIAKICG